jgi:hypothetical protein
VVGKPLEVLTLLSDEAIATQHLAHDVCLVHSRVDNTLLEELRKRALIVVAEGSLQSTHRDLNRAFLSAERQNIDILWLKSKWFAATILKRLAPLVVVVEELVVALEDNIRFLILPE